MGLQYAYNTVCVGSSKNTYLSVCIRQIYMVKIDKRTRTKVQKLMRTSHVYSTLLWPIHIVSKYSFNSSSTLVSRSVCYYFGGLFVAVLCLYWLDHILKLPTASNNNGNRELNNNLYSCNTIINKIAQTLEEIFNSISPINKNTNTKNNKLNKYLVL